MAQREGSSSSSAAKDELGFIPSIFQKEEKEEVDRRRYAGSDTVTFSKERVLTSQLPLPYTEEVAHAYVQQ